MCKEIDELISKLGLEVENKKVFLQAVTHTSFAHEHKGKRIKHNERLEFLGDAVLELIVSELLFFKYPDLPEGELTKFRAAMVCEESLFKIANSLELGKYLRLGRGEEASGGRERPSILADAVEALIGALYLDRGYEKTREIVARCMEEVLVGVENEGYTMDYKTALQEFTQDKYDACPNYKIVKEDGPDHDKEFVAEVVVKGEVLAEGRGKSKKEAEQKAAKVAWRKMDEGENI